MIYLNNIYDIIYIRFFSFSFLCIPRLTSVFQIIANLTLLNVLNVHLLCHNCNRTCTKFQNTNTPTGYVCQRGSGCNDGERPEEISLALRLGVTPRPTTAASLGGRLCFSRREKCFGGRGVTWCRWSDQPRRRPSPDPPGDPVKASLPLFPITPTIRG